MTEALDAAQAATQAGAPHDAAHDAAGRSPAVEPPPAAAPTPSPLPVGPSPLPVGPRRLASVYRGLLGLEVQAASAYRAQLVLGLLNWTVPLVFLALWRRAAADGPIDGITQTQFATYFCLLLLTTNVQIIMPVIFEFGHLVYSGQLSAMLLRPHHPLHSVVARALAENVYRLPPLVALVPLALWLTGGSTTRAVGPWLLAGALTLLGTVAVTYLAALSGALAFWMTKAQGVQGLLVGAEWILAGIVAPIALLPGILPTALRHQPFWFAEAAGPELLSGMTHPGLATGIGQLGEATAWVVGLHLVYRAVWRRALRTYEAVGT